MGCFCLSIINRWPNRWRLQTSWGAWPLRWRWTTVSWLLRAGWLLTQQSLRRWAKANTGRVTRDRCPLLKLVLRGHRTARNTDKTAPRICKMWHKAIRWRCYFSGRQSILILLNCIRCAFSSPDWFPDQNPGAGSRAWLYLPGPEGRSFTNDSVGQFHQTRTDWMCPDGHREGTSVFFYFCISHLFIKRTFK